MLARMSFDAPGDSRSDQMLVAALNRGEAAAFDALYRRHRDWCWRVARRFARDDHEAADVVQEAFMHLLGRFPGFRLSGKLTTYLYPVVRNLAITAGRRSGRWSGRGSGRLGLTERPPERPGEGADAGRGGVGDWGGVEDRSEVAAALGTLPEIHREVLLMRAVDEMSVAEIALALGIPEGTVKSRLHHALEAVRRAPGLERYFDER